MNTRNEKTIRRGTKKFKAIIAAGTLCEEWSNATGYVWKDGDLAWGLECVEFCGGTMVQTAINEFELRIKSGAGRWRFHATV